MPQDDSSALPEGYFVRHALDQDIAHILSLIAASDASFGVAPSGFSALDVREGWEKLTIESDTWCMLAPDGSLAAYGEVTDFGSGKIRADGYVHPEHRGKGLGTALARRMEARARELVGQTPDGAQVSLSNGVLQLDTAAAALLERDGYIMSRVFLEMRITLSEPPATPTLPAGLRLRAFIPGQDERAVFDTVEAAFADHWDYVPRQFEEWLGHTQRPEFDPALWLLAETEDGAIAAVALGTLRADHGYIDDVATLRAWRKRGLASALLRASFRVFWEHGMRVVALNVDAQNPTGATRVYEAAGMATAMSAAFYRKILREGVDLATSAQGASEETQA